MNRSILLSSCGDPFLSLFAIKLWQERWYDEIDTLYININNHKEFPKEVTAGFLSRLSKDPKIRIIFHPQGIGNGRPIKEMALISESDLIMLLEEDGFIFEKGIVNDCFQKIESDQCDVVGSPRFSCGNEIAEVSKKKYNLDYSTYGDCGPNFWPNFFFCKRKDLLKTDLNFGSKAFQAGEYCKELDYTFKEINHGDTFVWACMQLRSMGLRFHNIPQYHADPYEIENKEKKLMNWINGIPTHIHGGSLSSGWGGYLSGQIPDVSNDSAMQEMESRCAFWLLASAHVEGFDDFGVEYGSGINMLILNAKLNSDRIKKKYDIYKELMHV